MVEENRLLLKGKFRALMCGKDVFPAQCGYRPVIQGEAAEFSLQITIFTLFYIVLLLYGVSVP